MTQNLDRERPPMLTRREAAQAGIRDHELRSARFTRVMHGVYAIGTPPVDLMTRAKAALAVSPAGTVLSHQTAARLWGGVVPDCSVIHLTTAQDRRLRRDGAVLHRTRHEVPVRRRYALPVTSAVRTFLDLAGALDLVELVVLGDSLVARGVVAPAELAQAAGTWRGVGAGTARKAARWVRAGVDSPRESRLRMLLVLAGLPEPTVNVVIRDEGGQWQFRLDLGYEEHHVAVEYDGRHHAEDPRQWRHDISRREALDQRKWRLVVVIGTDLYDDPGRVLSRVVGALREAGAPLPARLRSDWQRYFPSRAHLEE
jgi:hypothetical protein